MSIEKNKISDFYNNYIIINFNDPDELKSKDKVLKKQMEDLVNIVLPSLAKLGESNSEMPVGMLLASLVAENLVSKEKFIDVQNNLKEMKKLGELLQFDIKLTATLNALVP